MKPPGLTGPVYLGITYVYLHRREIQKYLDMGAHEDRNAQFENIARIKRDYLNSLDPILSIDTKKRELLGTFYRDGRVTRAGGCWLSTTTSPATPTGS